MDDNEKKMCFSCKCKRDGKDQKDCRNYIDYEKDGNCCLVSIEKNGSMTLKEIGERIGLTAHRIYQIEKGALKKIKNMKERDK